MNFNTRILFLFFFIYTSLVSQAQEDSLALKDLPEIRALVNRTIAIDSTKAIALSHYLSKRAKATQDFKEIGNAKLTEAFVLCNIGRLEEGIRQMDSIIVAAQAEKETQLEMWVQMAKGGVYNTQGRFAEGIAPYYRAADLAKADKDYATYFSIVNNVGWLKGSLEDYLGAVDILKEGLTELSKESIVLKDTLTTKPKLQMALLSNIAKAYGNAKLPDSSIQYVEKAFAMADPIKDSCYVKIFHIIRGHALILKNDFGKAEFDIEAFSTICPPMNKNERLIVSLNRGKIYYGTKQYRAAVDTLNVGLKMYDVPEEEEKYMRDYYKVLAKAHKSLGQLDSANYYLEKHINTTSEFGELRTDISTSFKNQEIDAFENELKALAKEKSQKEKLLLYGGIAGGMVILVLVIGLVRSNKQRKENEAKFQALLDKVNAAPAAEVQIVNTKDTVLEERGSSEVNDETTQQILNGLKKLESQHYYLHPACSAHNVAKRIKTNTTYLSKVINANYEKNFSTYINDLRVNYAVLKLKEDTKFRGYTIHAIATELGYKSADSFTKYFKQHTGLLPSFYIKKLNQIAA